MPFSAPLADCAAPFAPFVAAGEPWACALVVCAGGFCDENLELMLDIHELRRRTLFWSGGVKLPDFSTLPRLSSVGRFVGIFCGGVVGAPEGCCATSFCALGAEVGAVVGSWRCLSAVLLRGREGRPPCEDVLGGASRVRPGEDGACWRW
jgi:hypothetical protein